MTTNRSQWENLIDQAREDSAPTLDVSAAVAQRIATTSQLAAIQMPSANWPTWTSAGLSVAAAVMMMLTAAFTGVSLNNPFGDWLSSMFMVIS